MRRLSGQQHPLQMPITNVPQAPIFDVNLIANAFGSLKTQQPMTEMHSSYEQTTVNNE